MKRKAGHFFLGLFALAPTKIVMREAPPCHKGLQAYQNTLHAHLRKDCLPCHDTGGLADKPHSVSDPETSLQRIIAYVNWSDIPKSYLVKKGGNGHCHDHGGTCTSTEAVIEEQLKTWWEQGQKECPNFGNVVTAPLALPTDEIPRVLSYPLASQVPEITGAKLELRARYEEGAYVLDQPRLMTKKTGVKIQGLSIAVNGRWQAGANSWQRVRARVAPQDSPLISTTTLRVAKDRDEDTLAIGIQTLSPTDAFDCHEWERFRKEVLPVIANRDCYRCHGGGPSAYPGTAAKERLNMAVDESSLCRNLLGRGNGMSAIDCALISLPLRGTFGHPREIPLAAEILPSWEEWIRAEEVHRRAPQSLTVNQIR